MSEEERLAYENLTEAISRVQYLITPNGPNGVITKFVVVGMRQGYDDDGEAQTINFLLAKDGSIPVSDTLGLLEHARLKTARRISDSI